MYFVSRSRIFWKFPVRPPEPQPRVAVALDPALHREEEVGPHRLRTGIAAPDPAERRGEQEEAEARHDQKARDEVELVRPDLDPEEEEPPVRKVQKHRLVGQVGAAVEPDPGRDIVDAQGDDHDDPLEVPERARDPLGENGFTGCVELLRLFGRTHGGNHLQVEKRLFCAGSVLGGRVRVTL
jgi:hypothetical protein